jgi:membrane protease YdiL (CAAX protease family)
VSKKESYLVAECVVLFFVIPLLLYFVRHHLGFRILALVWVLAGVCVGLLNRHPAFDWKVLWQTAGLSSHLKGVLVTFLPLAICMGLLAWLLLPAHFLRFPRGTFEIWALVVVLYPPLLAYPQEVIFRCFFFERYRSIFSNQAAMILLNGLSFGLAHVFYGNWIAPSLATLGGILFAYRYVRTGSLLAVSLEHGLWGDYLFTVGIGWYFYSGSIQ